VGPCKTCAARDKKTRRDGEVKKVLALLDDPRVQEKVVAIVRGTGQLHTRGCAWHQDWHACDCGVFDGRGPKGSGA
jgi:hypothetical protein